MQVSEQALGGNVHMTHEPDHTFFAATPELVAAVANTFIENVLRDIGPSSMAKVRGRNHLPEYSDGACPTHDFCDGNQCMLDAIGTITGLTEMPDEASDPRYITWSKIVDAAWNLARACDFRAPYLLEWAEVDHDRHPPGPGEVPFITTCRARHTITHFAECEVWDSRDLFGVHALDLGESYVKSNAPNGVTYTVTRVE